MTDQIFYEELRATIRDAIASYLDTYTDEELRELATESLSPLSRPTLADMTPEEREACQWMQADIIGGDEPLVITRIDRTDWSAVILDRNGRLDGVPAGAVTPRPDLPRMTFPGDQKPDSSLPEGWRLADHPDYGRVIVTSASPDADGYAYFVSSATGPIGNDWHLCTPDDLTYLDQGADTAPEVHPGVTVGEPVTDPQVMLGISIDAPDGTVVVGRAQDCHPKATVKSDSTWQSTAGMRAHLYHALGEGDYSELESVTVVRWGKETDQ